MAWVSLGTGAEWPGESDSGPELAKGWAGSWKYNEKTKPLMNLLAPTSPCWESPASSCLGCWGGLGGFRSLHDKFNYKYHLNDESLLKNWFRFTQQTLWPFHWSLRCPFSSQLNTSDAWKKTLQQNRSKLWITEEFMLFFAFVPHYQCSAIGGRSDSSGLGDREFTWRMKINSSLLNINLQVMVFIKLWKGTSTKKFLSYLPEENGKM